MLGFFHGYRDSPVSAVFWSPGNRTIWKTALIGDWFSTKIAILDFWIFKVPFFAYFNDFNQQESTLLNNLQFVFYVTALRIINQLDSWKIIVHYLCTYAEKKGTIRKNWKNLKHFEKKISEKIEILSKNLEKNALNRGIALFSAVYKPH